MGIAWYCLVLQIQINRYFLTVIIILIIAIKLNICGVICVKIRKKR